MGDKSIYFANVPLVSFGSKIMKKEADKIIPAERNKGGLNPN